MTDNLNSFFQTVIPFVAVAVIGYSFYAYNKISKSGKQFVQNCQNDNPEIQVFGNIVEANKLLRTKPITLRFDGNFINLHFQDGLEPIKINLPSAKISEGGHKEWLQVTITADGKTYTLSPYKQKSWYFGASTIGRLIPAREALANTLIKHGATRA